VYDWWLGPYLQMEDPQLKAPPAGKKVAKDQIDVGARQGRETYRDRAQIRGEE
jgi:hypothetical protein